MSRALRTKTEKRASGQSLVEFALAIPFIVLVIVAIMYFGRVFYVKQAVFLASQEGARAISRIPNLYDPAVRQLAAGFSPTGELVNPDSVIAGALGSARLLSGGTTGSLPPGSKVKILPWDAEDADDVIPQGTVAVRIHYPFMLLRDPFDSGSSDFSSSVDVWSGDGGPPVNFTDFEISERTVALSEVYQP